MQFQPIATGFAFLEAPRIDRDGTLYFSDVMLGAIYRRKPDGAVDQVLADRPWIGGLALDEAGGLVRSGRGGLFHVDIATGAERPLLTTLSGRPIRQVNDIHPDGNGGLYAGTIDGTAFEEQRAPEPGALFHLAPSGQVTILWDGIPISNGLGTSPDGRILYQADTWTGIWAYALGADGMPSGRTLLAALPDCDGLAVDAEGHVWAAACRSGAIKRFAPDGTLDRVVLLPAKDVTSLTFGGPDLRDLYVTTAYEGAVEIDAARPMTRTAAVYRGRSDVPGLPTPRTRFG